MAEHPEADTWAVEAAQAALSLIEHILYLQDPVLVLLLAAEVLLITTDKVRPVTKAEIVYSVR